MSKQQDGIAVVICLAMCGVMFLVLYHMKSTGQYDMPWWYVLSPIVIPAMSFLVSVVFIGIGTYLFEGRRGSESERKKKNE